MSIPLAITFFFLVLGSLALGLALLLLRRESAVRQASPRNDRSGELTQDDLERFAYLLDEKPGYLLQSLQEVWFLKGPATLRPMVRHYLDTSGKEVRKKILAAFAPIYTADGLDEEGLDDLFARIERLENGDDEHARGLLAKVRETAPLQMEVLALLNELFGITDHKITKIKHKLKKCSELASEPGEEKAQEGPWRDLLATLQEFCVALAETLPPKGIKNKEIRRKALNASLDRIEALLGSGIVADRETLFSPEAALTRMLFLKTWDRINRFMASMSFKKRALDAKINPEDPDVANRLAGPLTPARKMSAVFLFLMAAGFYAAAAYSWRLNKPHRFEPEKAKLGLVKIQTPDSSGSGFFIDHDHLIVTNHHVVEDHRRVTILVKKRSEPDREPRALWADVVREDPQNDLAVLKLAGIYDESELPGGFQMRSGRGFPVATPVHVLGNPFGERDFYSKGYIAKSHDDFLFMEANIGPGNSGGPIFNDQGIVIGVATAYAKPDGGNFGYAIGVGTEKVWRLIREIQRGN